MAQLGCCLVGAVVHGACVRAVDECPCSVNLHGRPGAHKLQICVRSAVLDDLQPGFWEARRPYVEIHFGDEEPRATMLADFNAKLQRWVWQEPILCEVVPEDSVTLVVGCKVGLDFVAFRIVAQASQLGSCEFPMNKMFERMRPDARQMWTTGDILQEVQHGGKVVGQLTVAIESTRAPSAASPQTTFGCTSCSGRPAVAGGDTGRYTTREYPVMGLDEEYCRLPSSQPFAATEREPSQSGDDAVIWQAGRPARPPHVAAARGCGAQRGGSSDQVMPGSAEAFKVAVVGGSRTTV